MFDHNFPNFVYFYRIMLIKINVAIEEKKKERTKIILLLFIVICFFFHTCACAFFLHKITVSRPTRSITSRTRSCFSRIRAGTSVVFDEDEDFFFHVFDDSVNITSLIVSPTLRKSFAFAI